MIAIISDFSPGDLIVKVCDVSAKKGIYFLLEISKILIDDLPKDSASQFGDNYQIGKGHVPKEISRVGPHKQYFSLNMDPRIRKGFAVLDVVAYIISKRALKRETSGVFKVPFKFQGAQRNTLLRGHFEIESSL